MTDLNAIAGHMMAACVERMVFKAAGIIVMERELISGGGGELISKRDYGRGLKGFKGNGVTFWEKVRKSRGRSGGNPTFLRIRR